jgi:hypothetical protein
MLEVNKMPEKELKNLAVVTPAFLYLIGNFRRNCHGSQS